MSIFQSNFSWSFLPWICKKIPHSWWRHYLDPVLSLIVKTKYHFMQIQNANRKDYPSSSDYLQIPVQIYHWLVIWWDWLTFLYSHLRDFFHLRLLSIWCLILSWMNGICEWKGFKYLYSAQSCLLSYLCCAFQILDRISQKDSILMKLKKYFQNPS